MLQKRDYTKPLVEYIQVGLVRLQTSSSGRSSSSSMLLACPVPGHRAWPAAGCAHILRMHSSAAGRTSEQHTGQQQGSSHVQVHRGQGSWAMRHTTRTVCHGQRPPDTPHCHLSVLLALLQSGKPFFGICLGMQLLFDGSDESGGCEGLGLIKGKVRACTEGRGVTNATN